MKQKTPGWVSPASSEVPSYTEGFPPTWSEDDSPESPPPTERESTSPAPMLYVLPNASVIVSPHENVAIFKPATPDDDMTPDVCDVIFEEIMALHRGCDRNRLEAAVKTLYEAYAQDGVLMEKFAGVTMKDLYRVETTFQTNVWVHVLSLVQMSEMQLVDTRMEVTSAREHVYGRCASSLSRRRVPFDSVDIRTTGRREHPSGRIVAVLPVPSHF